MLMSLLLPSIQCKKHLCCLISVRYFGFRAVRGDVCLFFWFYTLSLHFIKKWINKRYNVLTPRGCLDVVCKQASHQQRSGWSEWSERWNLYLQLYYSSKESYLHFFVHDVLLRASRKSPICTKSSTLLQIIQSNGQKDVCPTAAVDC